MSVTTTTAPLPKLDWDSLYGLVTSFKEQEKEQRRKLFEGLNKMTCAVCGDHAYLRTLGGPPDIIVVCKHVMDELKQASVKGPESPLLGLTGLRVSCAANYEILKGQTCQ